METKIELPRYRCHKEVWALKIKAIDRMANGDFLITPEKSLYPPFIVSDTYVLKHNPVVGGYYVLYKGGYESFSPADVFEEGYTLI